MSSTFRMGRSVRHGAIVLKVALVMVPLLGTLGLAIDYGYLLKVRTDLQRAADHAALASVRELVPDAYGNQDLDTVRSTLRKYAAFNMGEIEDFEVRDSDIEIGRFDPNTVYSGVNLLSTGTMDTVRVTLRRDHLANSPVSLFFANFLGHDFSGVQATATAVLRRGTGFKAGAHILPFAIPESVWNSKKQAESFRIYGDGKVKDAQGKPIPGNWGTVDIGAKNNSTSDLRDQIENGLRQSDLDALHSDGRISQETHIDASESIGFQGDPGLSSGVKHAVEAVEGTVRFVPIYDKVKGKGNNAEYQIIGWGTVRLLDSKWKGNKKTWIELEKASAYDANLLPQTSLDDDSGTIDNAFTTAVLVE